MPIHDWSRVDPGIFHHLHLKWIARLDDELNGGLLPEPFYSLAEPALGEAIPDVITLRAQETAGAAPPPDLEREEGTVPAVLQAPAGVLVEEWPPLDPYSSLARRIVIKDRLRGDLVVAVIELVSRGNKSSLRTRDQFLDKLTEFLRRGTHLVLIDLQPATPLVPAGFHPLICQVHAQSPQTPPKDRPLQAVSYEVLASGSVRSHFAPLRVGDALAEMPLFLLPHRFVRLPLERTYTAVFDSLPRQFRETLEAT